MRTFADLLRATLQQQGLGVRAYARLIGVTPASVSQVLNQRRKPSLKTLDDWLDKLQITPEQRRDLVLAAHLSWAAVRGQSMLRDALSTNNPEINSKLL